MSAARRTSRRPARSLGPGAALLTASLVLAACGGSADDDAAAAVGGDGALSDCPATVVLQTNWFPEPEHAAAYQLIDPAEATLDAEAGIYSGPAVADGNVTVEIRAGGPFIGFQSNTALLYTDDEVMLGMVDTDESVRLSAEQPTQAVVTPLELNPQVLLWDPDKYDFASFADIGKSDATVLYFQGATYMDYLRQQGFVRAEQLDGSFDGSLTRIVAGEDVVIQGYVTQEPWRLENEFTDFGKEPGYLTLGDAGYDTYGSAWAGTPESVEANSACLSQLVPLLQQGQVDYMYDPTPVNEAISAYLEEIGQFFQITPERAAAITDSLHEDGIVANAPDGTLGAFDADRMERMTELLTGVFDDLGTELADGLTAEDIYTNEFIDPSISYDRSRYVPQSGS
ncbi:MULTISPECIES: ABC transporter substrate-binding protein [unclassified Modestobacter]